jgi:hypothetical protein
MLMMLADTGLVQRFPFVHLLLTRNSINLCNNLSDPSQGEGSSAHGRDDAAVITVGQIAVLHAWIHRTPVYDEASTCASCGCCRSFKMELSNIACMQL